MSAKFWLSLLLTICLFSTSNAADPLLTPGKVWIGTELGTLHTVGKESGNLIAPDHAHFRDKNYFFQGMRDLGLDYTRDGYRNDLWCVWNNQMRDPSANNNVRGYQNLPLLCSDQTGNGNHLKFLAYPKDTTVIGGNDPWPTSMAWLAPCLKKDDSRSSITQVKNFGALRGNAARLLNGIWRVDDATYDFVIGDGGNDNDLADNWVIVPDPYTFHIGSHQSSKYVARFEVKKLTSPAGNKKCFSFYVGIDTDDDNVFDPTTYTYDIYEDDILESDGSEAEMNDEGYITIDITQTIPDNNGGIDMAGTDPSRYFAMKWYRDAGSFDVYKFYFESKYYDQLRENYEGTANGDPVDDMDGDYWDHFQSVIKTEVNYLNARNLGFIAPEPWHYAYEAFSQASVHFRNDYPQNTFTAQWPAYNTEAEIERFLEEAKPGALIKDAFPIAHTGDGMPWDWSFAGEESYNGVDMPTYSVQDCWDDYIGDGETGLRAAATAASLANNGPHPFHCGIQSSGEKDWKDDVTYQAFYADPSPNQVKCQGFLGMTFAAKGFFYSYYGPRYTLCEGDQPSPFMDPPTSYNQPDNPRWIVWNGAQTTGLVTLCPDSSDLADTTIVDDDELKEAASNIMGAAWNPSQAGDEKGWLRKNAKWYGAKKFIDYVRAVEPVYSRLEWNLSENAAEDNDIGYVLDVTSTDYTKWFVLEFGIWEPYWGWRNDPSDSTFVQVAIYDGPLTLESANREIKYFMLVNRRCYENDLDTVASERRKITATLNFGNNALSTVITECSTGAEVASGVGDLQFSYYIPPGEGRLFMASAGGNRYDSPITTEVTLDGPWIIGSNTYVSSNGKLILGSTADITLEGDLYVYGSLSVRGNLDNNGYPTVNIHSVDGNRNGRIILSGSSGTDSVSFASMSQLKQGLKVNKTGGTTVLRGSSFAFNAEEGIYGAGGTITIDRCTFADNESDGGYFYNSLALIDSSYFLRNSKNGIYAYSINSYSSVSQCTLALNSSGTTTSPEGNLRFFGSSPSLSKNVISSSSVYGLYGANGSYPVLYFGTSNAANTITGNASHETYWDQSWPLLDEGYNNFDREDDTLIFITSSTTIPNLNMENNWWGSSSGPYTSTPHNNFVGPCTWDYNPWCMNAQTRLRGEVDLDQKSGGHGFGGIADNDRDAVEAFKAALTDEAEQPERAIAAYRNIIRDYSESAYAPMAVERLLWMIRNHTSRNEHDQEVGRIGRYFESLADTAGSPALVWKARRAALWALAAQHRYDEAIRGFEQIIAENDCLRDSVYAVIDAGTLHLEAQEWARHDSLDHIQSVFGNRQELCPASFPAHRKKTDELLSLLNGESGEKRGLIPTEFFLNQNYPNPFNSVTSITYGLPQASKISLKIYDVSGREVANLVQGQQRAGFHKVAWQGVNQSGLPVASGMYFIRMEAGQFVKTQKMTLVK